MAANIFNSIQVDKPKRNAFDLTHDVKFSMSMGKLVPTLAMECVPGDRVKLGAQHLVRFAPMLAPVMHRFDVSLHYFFVPNRILWDNWEYFITNSPKNPGDPLPAFPYINTANAYTRLHDYLGIPPSAGGPSSGTQVSALPFAAYQCIYDEYYRDQNNIPDPINFSLVDGNNTANPDLTVLRTRAWEHDYFTSALPFAQKGPSVEIPMTFQDAPVKLNPRFPGESGNATFNDTGGNSMSLPIDQSENDEILSGRPYADNTDITGSALITDLRRATKVQEWLERAARVGGRYIEFLKGFFNVTSSDKRLQRPEYITGVKSPVIISEVLNTTGTSTSPQGDMAGHGISVTGGKSGSYTCEEHGYIICMMSILPKPAYQQGIPKHFLKFTDPFQWFFPQFEHIGEQPIENKELYYTGDPLIDDDTFGYTPRYAEYKYMANRVAGEFRTSLNFWHDGRIFGNLPTLSQQFIECVPDKRIFAVTAPDVDDIYCQVVHEIMAIRPMAKYGTPDFM